MISLANWMACWTSILVKISQGVCSILLSVSKGLTLKFLGFLPKFLVSPFLFYFFYFLFWKTLICWRYLALRSIWIEQNSDAVEIVFELALYEICFWLLTVNLNWFWAVVVVQVSQVNENVADIIGLSAAFGCWVKVLSLFRRRSELCNNFQFGDVLLMWGILLSGQRQCNCIIIFWGEMHFTNFTHT